MVLVPPGSGDDVQMLKAGILEIGSIYVVNKMDRDGAGRTVRDLKQMIRRAGPSSDTDDWSPPVLKTNALTGENIPELEERIQAHRNHLQNSGRGAQKRRQRRIEEMKKILSEKINNRADQLIENRLTGPDRTEALTDGSEDPYCLAEQMLDELLDNS